MNRIPKILPFAVVLGLLFAFTGAKVSAQALKIGFVKDDRIKSEYKEWQRAQEQWEVESKAWDDEAQSKQDELQQLMDDYDKQRLILSEDKKKEREAAIRTKQEALDAYTKQIYGPGGTAEKKQQMLLQPLLDKVSKAIEAVAEKENYDVIFTLQSGLGYIKPSYDVTDKVLAELENEEQ
ncbi:MAG TPA: OmpH family outer membrane protein [candidate division Zixibacteria bacterium]|nr:OmpH family outer membrane protein [candidate division Zixibacteria bacterium]